ncbi:MAG: DUF302 domain-containing protein [Bacteroidota bacterium]
MIRILIALFLVSVSSGNSTAQEGMMKPPQFQVMVPSKYSFDDTVELLKSAIEGQNFMVISELDIQKMLRMVGVQRKGMKKIFFLHPSYMKRILEANRHATAEPPLKIDIMEMPNGRAMVRYIKPSHIFGQYEGMEEISKELETVLLKLMESVQQ